MAEPLIVELQGLCAGYGEIQVLWGVDMAVRQGEITALIGSNGAGKTTLMRALSGLIPTPTGYYFADGKDVTGDSAAAILARRHRPRPGGTAAVRRDERRGQPPDGRLFAKGGETRVDRDDRVYATFPKLRDRRHQAAATLSGGEQQMCAIGRGLMSRRGF